MNTTGPNERELRKVLHASAAALTNASHDWESGRVALDRVKVELDKGIAGMDEEMGVNTREAALASFRAMRRRVHDHRVSLRLGRDALHIASDAIDKATSVAQTGLPAVAKAPARKQSADPAADEVDYAKQVRVHAQSVGSRETVAAEALRRLNESLDISITKLRRARGVAPQDDPVPPVPPVPPTPVDENPPPWGPNTGRPVDTSHGTPHDPVGGGPGTGTPVHPGSPGQPGQPGTGDPGWPGTGGPAGPGGAGVPGVPAGPGSPGSTSPAGGSVFGLPGGVTGSLSGAVMGGGSIASALRGLRGASTSLSEAATAPSSARAGTGAGGVMGRSSGSGSGSAGRAGSRSGRSAGASMGGRNGRKGKGKGKGKASDLLVEEDAWLDDEGAGPDVLD